MEQDVGREVLSTVKLKQFQARRKWARCVEAIRAMNKLSDIMTRRQSVRSIRSISCTTNSSTTERVVDVPERRATSVYSRRPLSVTGDLSG